MTCHEFACEPAHAIAIDLSIARRVVNRTPVDVVSTERPPRAGDRLYTHTTLSGFGAGFLEHVWWRDGVEVARHYLPVGSRRRWRGWTCHRLEAGRYLVEVVAPDGERLAAAQFDVEDAVAPRGEPRRLDRAGLSD